VSGVITSARQWRAAIDDFEAALPIIKVSKPQRRSIDDLRAASGAVIGSHWVTGNGRNSSRRLIPVGGAEIDIEAILRYPMDFPDYVRACAAEHPKAKTIIALFPNEVVDRALRTK